METLNIYQKLHSIQSRINGLGKDKEGHGYKYVTGDKVLENIKPMMNELGLLLKQEILSIENTRQDYTVGRDNRAKSEILSKVNMRFTWIDVATGDKDENLFGANGQNDWDKGVGSALTYAERYFLLKFFHIATDQDDIDNVDRKDESNLSAPVPKDNRPELTEALYKKVMARITNGEPGVFEKTLEAYKIPEAYRANMKEASEGVFA